MWNSNTRKSCVVPKYKSTTTKTSEKLFILVPMDIKIRKKWLNAMKRLDPFGDKSKVYCCEDHFDVSTFTIYYVICIIVFYCIFIVCSRLVSLISRLYLVCTSM